MPHITSWQHRTIAHIPPDGWEEAWFSFTSWRGYQQSVPGWLATRVAARELESGTVEVHVDTLFEHESQLARWLEGPFLPRRIVDDLSTGGEIVHESVLETLN